MPRLGAEPGCVCVSEEGGRPWSPFTPLHAPEAPAAAPWGARAGLTALGRAAGELAGGDPAVPSGGHLSAGRRHGPCGEYVMAHPTGMPVPRLLWGPLSPPLGFLKV